MPQELSVYAAAIVSVSSLVLGVALKWGFDILTERRREQHEDRVRFIADKRLAYAEHHNAAAQVIRHLEDAGEDPDAFRKAGTEAVDRLNRSVAPLYFLAPWSVLQMTVGQKRISVDPEELKRQVAAFVAAARLDLRVKD